MSVCLSVCSSVRVDLCVGNERTNECHSWVCWISALTNVHSTRYAQKRIPRKNGILYSTEHKCTELCLSSKDFWGSSPGHVSRWRRYRPLKDHLLCGICSIASKAYAEKRQRLHAIVTRRNFKRRIMQAVIKCHRKRLICKLRFRDSFTKLSFSPRGL